MHCREGRPTAPPANGTAGMPVNGTVGEMPAGRHRLLW
jgi:hypothetical protein